MATDIATITLSQLEAFELTIRKGQATFLAVGQALMEIRRNKGYRLRGFDTFETYCQATFGFTDRHGRRMIAAARTVQAAGEPVKSESVARVLAKVNPDLIGKLKNRLALRNLTLQTAPAAAIEGALRDLRGEAPSVPAAKRGKCPACGKVPSAYWRVKGRWKCGACGKQVSVTAKAVRAQPVDEAEQAARDDFDPEPLPATKSLPVHDQPVANPSRPVRAKVRNEWNSSPRAARRGASAVKRFCKCGVLLPIKLPDNCLDCGRPVKK